MHPSSSSGGAVRPLITVSVVSHGDAAPLQLFLQTLERHESRANIQLIVTDNLGHELPELDPAPWHSVTLVRNERPAGYALNHNSAFARAEGKYFCVANPDIRLIQGVFTPLMKSIEAGEGDIAGPLIVDSAGVVQDSFRSLPSPAQILQRGLRRWAPLRDFVIDREILRADWIAGIFILMPHATFARLNGFDSRYRLYFEDVDLCTRARLQGLKSFVNTRVRIEHDARRSSHRQGRYLYWHLQSMGRFFTSAVYREARRAEAQGPVRSV